MTRIATIDRKTNETEIHLRLFLDGTGEGKRQSGIGFLDHMLDLLAKHDSHADGSGRHIVELQAFDYRWFREK